MEDEKLWSYYFGAVCSMQFHPRNCYSYSARDNQSRIDIAADIADRMLIEHAKRWPVETEEPCHSEAS